MTWSFIGGTIAFAGLDLTVYATHRAFHVIPDGWRIHALHHSDTHIDATPAVRHHPAEHLISAAVYSAAILMFRVPAEIIALHGVLLFSAAALTHAKLRMSEYIERLLGWVVITPDLHLVH